MTKVHKLALVGLPGSGKSTVAPVVAERLGWDYVDLDSAVAAAAGRPLSTIFAEDGEAAFRELELIALVSALGQPGETVIACGGGLMAQDEARRRLLEGAFVVLLDAPDEVLLGRMGNGKHRPLLGDDPASALPRLRASPPTRRLPRWRTASSRPQPRLSGSLHPRAHTVSRSALGHSTTLRSTSPPTPPGSD